MDFLQRQKILLGWFHNKIMSALNDSLNHSIKNLNLGEIVRHLMFEG